MRSVIQSEASQGGPAPVGKPSAGCAQGARFSKRFTEAWHFRATLRNSLRAWVAAERSKYLRVPQVLSADAEALRIDYELLDGWSKVRAVIRARSFGGLRAAELRRMFWTIGAALEEFHRHTHRIHGDFDFDNILVRRDADRAAFVDFTPPVYTNFREYNQADPYWDIAMLVIGVRAKYPPHLIHLALRPELGELARAFVQGYFDAAPVEYDQRRLEHSMHDILENTYLGRSFAGRYLRRTHLFRTDDLAPGR